MKDNCMICGEQTEQECEDNVGVAHPKCYADATPEELELAYDKWVKEGKKK